MTKLISWITSLVSFHSYIAMVKLCLLSWQENLGLHIVKTATFSIKITSQTTPLGSLWTDKNVVATRKQLFQY